ncbi:hypothetical protein ACN47E_002346 [Coniothyrium glycines]
MLARFGGAMMAMQVGLAAAGNAVIGNRCSYDIYVWSVGSGSGSNAIHVPARSQHIEPFQGTSMSLKISKSEQCEKPTQFEYSIVNNQLWYDISFVDCANGEDASNCPGHAEGLAMSGSNTACRSVECAAGQYCPTTAYYVPQPLVQLGLAEPVYTCQGAGTNMDLYMTMCSSQPSLRRSIAGRLSVDIN